MSQGRSSIDADTTKPTLISLILFCDSILKDIMGIILIIDVIALLLLLEQATPHAPIISDFRYTEHSSYE